LKIIHIITDLFTGGAEMMLYKLLSELKDNGHEYWVISLRDKGAIGKKIESLGVPVFPLDISPKIPSPLSIFNLRKIIRQISPDLIQGWMYHGNLAATLACKFNGKKVPVVWNVRQTLYNLKDEKLFSRLMITFGSKISKKPSFIIYNSQVAKKQHEKIGFSSENGVYIPNGFDLEAFSPDNSGKNWLKEKLNIQGDGLLIGLIARFHPIKDHFGFLEAAKILMEKYSKAHFVLAGRGVDVGNLKIIRKIKELGLLDRVHLLGESQEMPRVMSALDILTSCSWTTEGFSNAIGEAMACGVPCVVTDVGDSSFIVGDTGKVVPPKNPQKLCEAWVQLIELGKEKRKILGKRARGRIGSEFSIESISQLYTSLYQGLKEKPQRTQ